LVDTANGDADEPKTARFVEGGEEGSPRAANGETAPEAKGEEVPEVTGVLVPKGMDDVSFFDAKRFWPLTAAKGELVDAYAMKPL
jgi:hypothetical protein